MTKIKGSELIRYAAATPLENGKFELADKMDEEFFERYARQMISMGLYSESINPIFEIIEFWVEGKKLNLGNLKFKGDERK